MDDPVYDDETIYYREVRCSCGYDFLVPVEDTESYLCHDCATVAAAETSEDIPPTYGLCTCWRCGTTYIARHTYYGTGPCDDCEEEMWKENGPQASADRIVFG